MGTRADFYVGRGESAEWLGSIAWDGYPDGEYTVKRGDKNLSMNYRTILEAKTESEFRQAVGDLSKERDDFSGPEHGWPWPWETSHTTDWAYAFDGGLVFASCFGTPWVEASVDLELPDEVPGEPPVFPDMSKVQRVTFGERSGVIVVGGNFTP